jgi:hypothetical protein
LEQDIDKAERDRERAGFILSHSHTMGRFLHRRSSSTTQPPPPTRAPTLSTTPPTNTPSPLLSLPTEIYRQIATYLTPLSAASLSLSTRTALYALGTQHLALALAQTTTPFEKRAVLEHTLERAFPSSWFCAWCGGFHAWSASDGPLGDSPSSPSSSSSNANNDDSDPSATKCVAYNGTLHAPGYTLRYHHVRLALHRALYGAAHGIPLRAFDASHSATTSVFRTPVRAKTVHSARIVDGNFLLHATHTLLLPAWAARNRGVLDAVWAVLPRGLVGHRGDGGHGHDGLMAVLDNVLRRGWRYPFAQACGGCKSEYAVSCYEFAGGYVQLRIRTWRDLGRGESPFEGAWRAHCEGKGRGEGCVGEGGEIRRAFERGDVEAGVGVGAGEAERHDDDDEEEGANKGVYLALKRRRLNGIAREEIRRSRVVSWRTAAENDQVCRREEERRWEAARVAAEKAARFEAELTL